MCIKTKIILIKVQENKSANEKRRTKYLQMTTFEILWNKQDHLKAETEMGTKEYS